MGPAFLWMVSSLVCRPSKQVSPMKLNVQNSLFVWKTLRSTRWSGLGEEGYFLQTYRLSAKCDL